MAVWVPGLEVSTLLEILGLSQVLQRPLSPNSGFQPFLRFWQPFNRRISVPGYQVSTLLEILVSRRKMLYYINNVEFQPFLRFWEWSFPHALREPPESVSTLLEILEIVFAVALYYSYNDTFQPFLRFWLGYKTLREFYEQAVSFNPS